MNLEDITFRLDICEIMSSGVHGREDKGGMRNRRDGRYKNGGGTKRNKRTVEGR